METKYVIGVDFGTDSCRAIVVDTENGNEMSASIRAYPRWKKGLYCDPENNQYRQHPLDYVESMTDAIKEALYLCPLAVRRQIIGIGIDTTGSTPVLIDKSGTPLALLEEYRENPNAMFVLWKDHTSIKEAEEINDLARHWKTDYTAYSGGAYSSEWVWSKMLHVLRVDESVRSEAYSWVEHCDWIPALLTGNTQPSQIKRSRCAAGHKAMWSEQWGGLPSHSFWQTLDPLMNVFDGNLFSETYTCDQVAGILSSDWCKTLGLSERVIVSIGGLDSHLGAVGAQISEGSFVKVLGTSTCDMMVSHNIKDRLIAGICGQVDGSIIPGMVGLEAGQSAFGDIYAWFRKILEWPLYNLFTQIESIDLDQKMAIIEEVSKKILPELTKQIEQSSSTLDNDCIVATDWMNGRRTPYANQRLLGTISNLTLGSSAPMIFKGLVEATAYGSKAIVEHCLANGIEIKEVIAIGGISQKSSFVMQTLSDVLNMPIKIAKTEQTCALGAAMFAAVAAGVYPKIEVAQKTMGQGFSEEYLPDTIKVKMYEKLYDEYKKLCEKTSI